jgi:hypothetical protein
VTRVPRWLLITAALVLLAVIVWLTWNTPVDLDRMH